MKEFFILHTIFFDVYRAPFVMILFGSLFFILSVGYIGILVNKQIWRALCFLFVLISTAFILYSTVFNRQSEYRELILIPGYTINEAKSNPEVLRAAVMNIILFLPLGVFLPFCIDNKRNVIVIFIVILAGAGLSAVVETIQYSFFLGRAEIDDIILNTFGAVIGSVSFFLSEGFRKILSKSKVMQ